MAATRPAPRGACPTIAGVRCFAGLNAGRMILNRERADDGETAPRGGVDHLVVEQHAVLDGIDAVFDRERGAPAAVRVRGKLQAVPVGGVGGAADLARP